MMVTLKALAAQYRCLFVDVHGVLHDGNAAFPGATDALRAARAEGLFVVVMTNSPSRIEVVAGRLARAGVAPDCYDAIVTSGELTWRHVTDPATAPARPYFFCPDDGPAWVHEIASRTDNIDEADVVISAAISADTEADYLRSDLGALLDRAAARGLPMLCADSDVTYPLRGVIRLGPGWLAREYEKRGGNVYEFGKPCPPIYIEGLRVAGNPPLDKVLMVGDNLRTDVLGAQQSGHHSLLVLQYGVHRDLGAADLDREMQVVGARPTYVADSLLW
jgi:HAD superfamily hydrolase (TIGR01459 family)